MAKLINFFSTGLIIMSIILVAKSQTNTDINNFQTSLRNNLKATYPSLLKNISLITELLTGNDQAATISSKALDMVKQLTSSSVKPTGTKDLTAVSTPEDFIDTIVTFLVNGLVFGLKALLTPVILLVMILLIVVDILLNVVLWILRALLLTLLTDLGAGGLGQTLASILGSLDTAINNLINDVEKILGQLTILPDL